MNKPALTQEFNIQLETLLKKGYPEKSKLTKEEFVELVEPLRLVVEKLNVSNIDLENGYLPFVIVIRNQLVSSETAMSLVDKGRKNGITKLFPHQPNDFQIIPEENIPNKNVYLLIGIDRGKENINLPPAEALTTIRKNGHHPLTIDEGIAIVTHYPEFLIKNNCFSLLASRHVGDQRVPAIWINANKNPNLGWCWDGNPHTWLGSASAQDRIG